MHTIGILTDDSFSLHENGPSHPESPQRLEAVDRAVAAFDAPAAVTIPLSARPASTEELGLIHTARYIERIAATAERDRTILDLDTSTNRFTFFNATLAVGAAITAVDAVLEGRVDSAFCAVRPPGHHAERDRPMGFCIFNNAAIAARWAIEHRGLSRVAIVDWDVHHGNGTMHSLYRDPGVLYQSLHQSPHYPGTGTIDEIGEAEGTGFTVNVPCPPGTGDDEYLAVFERIIIPVLSDFRPELTIISAGYDAHRLDPIASLELSSTAYRTMARRIGGTVAPTSRVVAILEGGYHMTAIEEGVRNTLEGMASAGEEAYDEGRQPTVGRSAAHLIRALSFNLSPFWPSLRDS